MRKKVFLLLIPIIIASCIFKIWFISLAPQPIIWDQGEYLEMAQKIYHNILSVKTSRTYGYPLFLAANFLLFGENNIYSIIAVQLIIDIATALFLFYLGYKVFKSGAIAFLALLFQLFNPFTTAYIGVVLTEVLAAWTITLCVILFYLGLTRKKLRYFFFLGLAAGYLTQSRPAFLYWNILLLGLVPFFVKNILPKTQKLFTGFTLSIVLFSGTILVSLYQIAGNLKFYNQFSLTTVDQYLGRELYDGALLKTTPLFPDEATDYPLEMRIMYAEYSDVPRTASERKAMSDKYLSKAMDIIRKDPLDYALTRVKKMWSMWQKPNIFFYREPGFDNHWMYTYFANIVLLTFAAFGIYFALISRERTIRTVTIFCLSIIAYMTVAISLTHAEPRLTIPSYPILFLFAANGLMSLRTVVKKKTNYFFTS